MLFALVRGRRQRRAVLRGTGAAIVLTPGYYAALLQPYRQAAGCFSEADRPWHTMTPRGTGGSEEVRDMRVLECWTEDRFTVEMDRGHCVSRGRVASYRVFLVAPNVRP